MTMTVPPTRSLLQALLVFSCSMASQTEESCRNTIKIYLQFICFAGVFCLSASLTAEHKMSFTSRQVHRQCLCTGGTSSLHIKLVPELAAKTICVVINHARRPDS